MGIYKKRYIFYAKLMLRGNSTTCTTHAILIHKSLVRILFIVDTVHHASHNNFGGRRWRGCECAQAKETCDSFYGIGSEELRKRM